MTVTLTLIGAGRIANVHADAIAAHPGSRLAAVTDALPEAAQALAQRSGAEHRSTEDIAADPAIDGVLICTPTDTHADLIESFALAGKHVFCEKPVDQHIARA